MSDHREELEDRLSVAAEEEHMWKSLMEHPGWKRLTVTAREQQALAKETICLSPISSVGQCFAQEFYKGQFSGINTIMLIPTQQLEMAQNERRLVTKELEIEDVTEDEVAAASAGRLDGNPFGEFAPSDDDRNDSGNT